MKILLPDAAQEVTNRAGGDSTFWVYGTHLDDGDDRAGKDRFEEAKVLLSRIKSDTAIDDAVIVAGDFNQQRQVDYTEPEWASICANKQNRDSPRDDGVAFALTQAGFVCTFDSGSAKSKNWKPADPPPATHWSGTAIDYSYSRNLDATGVYVSPSDLSDHRLIITDWNTKVSK